MGDALAAFVDGERDRLPLFVPVLMGSGVAAYFGLRAEPPAWPSLAVLLVALVALAFRRTDAARIAAIAAASFACGLLAAQCATWRALPPVALPHHAVVVAGRVRAIDVLPEGGRRLTVASASLDGAAPLARLLHVRLRDNDPSAIADGDTIEVRALLRAPSPPAYPGGRDTRRDAFYAGLAGSGFALGAATVSRRGEAGAAGITAWWQSVRDRIASRIRAGLPGTDGAIAATLLVGISSAIPQADRQAFADSGLAHLLAVAGLHIGIVMGLVLGAVRTGLALSARASLRWPAREIAFVAALLAGGLYLLATGAHVPIVRSFAMATLATIAILLGRRAISMRGLAVAAVVILVLWPAELTGVSFQMSFAAVASLIAGYEVARPLFARLSGGGMGRRFALHLAALALTSLIAGLASMPYAAYYFGRIQIYFVLANLVAVPLTASWIMPWGLVSLALMPSGLEQIGLTPMGWGIALVLRVARLVAAMRGAACVLPCLPLGFLLAISAGIALLCILRTPWRFAGLGLIGLGLALGAGGRTPDLVVGEGAGLVAWKGQGNAVELERGRGASRYAIESMQRLWGLDGDPVKLPHEGTIGDAACTADRCRVTLRGATALILRDATGIGRDCGGAALLVSARPIRTGCPGAIRVDRISARRDGATAFWVRPDGTWRGVSDRDWSGARPWTVDDPSTKPGAAAPRPHAVVVPSLPMAATDQ